MDTLTHAAFRQTAHIFRSIVVPNTAPWSCGDFLALAEAFWPEFCPRIVMNPAKVDKSWINLLPSDYGVITSRNGTWQRRARILALCGMFAECVAASRGALRCADWFAEGYYHPIYEKTDFMEKAFIRSIVCAVGAGNYDGSVWLYGHFPVICNGLYMFETHFGDAKDIYRVVPGYSPADARLREWLVCNLRFGQSFLRLTYRWAMHRDPPDVGLLSKIADRIRSHEDLHSYPMELDLDFARACRSSNVELMKFLTTELRRYRRCKPKVAETVMTTILLKLCDGPSPVIISALRTLVGIWKDDGELKCTMQPALCACCKLGDTEGFKFFMDAGKVTADEAYAVLYVHQNGAYLSATQKGDLASWLIERFPDASADFRAVLDEWVNVSAQLQPPPRKKRKK